MRKRRKKRGNSKKSKREEGRGEEKQKENDATQLRDLEHLAQSKMAAAFFQPQALSHSIGAEIRSGKKVRGR